MKIIALIGSPKAQHSASEHLLGLLVDKLEYPVTCTIRLRHEPLTETAMTALLSADVLLLSFPLYVDGIPGHLLRHLESLEKRFIEHRRSIRVYGLSNAGYYEGIHNEVALACLKHWCERTELTYGGGLGIGAGAMQAFAQIPIFKNPRRSLQKALDHLSQAINQQMPSADAFVSPNFPRWLYKIMGNRMWFKAITKQGLHKKTLYRRP